MPCPYTQGCPFKDCKTKDDIANKMKELKKQEVWKTYFDKMKKCPLFSSKCPYSQNL